MTPLRPTAPSPPATEPWEAEFWEDEALFVFGPKHRAFVHESIEAFARLPD